MNTLIFIFVTRIVAATAMNASWPRESYIRSGGEHLVEPEHRFGEGIEALRPVEGDPADRTLTLDENQFRVVHGITPQECAGWGRRVGVPHAASNWSDRLSDG